MSSQSATTPSQTRDSVVFGSEEKENLPFGCRTNEGVLMHDSGRGDPRGAVPEGSFSEHMTTFESELARCSSRRSRRTTQRSRRSSRKNSSSSSRSQRSSQKSGLQQQQIETRTQQIATITLDNQTLTLNNQLQQQQIATLESNDQLQQQQIAELRVTIENIVDRLDQSAHDYNNRTSTIAQREADVAQLQQRLADMSLDQSAIDDLLVR
jgi:chromosome segregation ATPase